MIKYKIGKGAFIEEEEFFERLKNAIEINNTFEQFKKRGSKRTMEECKSDLRLYGCSHLYLVEDMYSSCPFFMADEEVFKIYNVIDKHTTIINGDIEGITAFSIARTLYKNGCRVMEV